MSVGEILYRIRRDPKYFTSALLTGTSLVLTACGGNSSLVHQIKANNWQVPMSSPLLTPKINMGVPTLIENVSFQPSKPIEKPDKWLQELAEKRDQLNAQTEYTYAGDLYYDVMELLGPIKDPTLTIKAFADGYVEEVRLLENDRGIWQVKRELVQFETEMGIFKGMQLAFAEQVTDDDIFEEYNVVLLPDGTDPKLLEDTAFISPSQFTNMLPRLRELTGLDFEQLKNLGDIETLQNLANISTHPAAYLTRNDLSIADAGFALTASGLLTMGIVLPDGTLFQVDIANNGQSALETFDEGSGTDQFFQPDDGGSQA